MVQIDYRIIIFTQQFFQKKSLWRNYPQTPTRGPGPPGDTSGGASPPTPPIKEWDPNATGTRPLN